MPFGPGAPPAKGTAGWSAGVSAAGDGSVACAGDGTGADVGAGAAMATGATGTAIGACSTVTCCACCVSWEARMEME